MKIAFGEMHHPPAVFWDMSLREWQAAFKGHMEHTRGKADEPMSRSNLTKLMEQYPDDRSSD